MQHHEANEFVQRIVLTHRTFGKPLANDLVSSEFGGRFTPDFIDQVVGQTIEAWDRSYGDIEQTKDAFYAAFTLTCHTHIQGPAEIDHQMDSEMWPPLGDRSGVHNRGTC